MRVFRALFCAAAFVSLYFIDAMAVAQTKFVAITIDDIPFQCLPPSYTLEEAADVNNTLLQHIHRAGTPVAAFINGSYCLSSDHTDDRIKILKKWINDSLVTVASHSMNHLNHSTTDIATFIDEVSTNDYLLRSFVGNKTIRHFRFPYNALGKDSIDQSVKREYLNKRGYSITPFTIESVDYLFNDLYGNELYKGNYKRADSLVDVYIDLTLRAFDEAEKISTELFGRNIKHIFLCHDNPLHAKCYLQLIEKLRKSGYTFISLDEALGDSAYQSPNYYHGKYGISWLFRWMPDAGKRRQSLKNSIDIDPALLQEYQALVQYRKK